jgi:adenylate kinase
VERILRSFLARRGINRETWLVLNGLPRHVGQAQALDAIVDISHVFELECSDETVFSRIHSNTGGDRTGREDDDFQAVRQKLSTYRQRTALLVGYYREHGVKKICKFEIGPTTTLKELQRFAFLAGDW